MTTNPSSKRVSKSANGLAAGVSRTCKSKGINSCVVGMIDSICLVVLLLGLVVFHNVFCLTDRGSGVLLEGVYRKRVKHIIQDTGGKKVEIVTNWLLFCDHSYLLCS